MYNGERLIPARFLILSAHFALLSDALWTSGRGCSMRRETALLCDQGGHGCRKGLVVGLGVALGLLCFEFLMFIVGLTMFNSNSALLSVTAHALSCAVTAYFILDQWQCGWFWWIFAIGSALPAAHDFCVALNAIIKKKY